MNNPELPMPDAFMAQAHRVAAEHALRDPFRGPRERQESRPAPSTTTRETAHALEQNRS